MNKAKAIVFQDTLFVCTDQQNDLFKLIEKKGIPFLNFSEPIEAIENAKINSSVIITADSYPMSRTKIDSSFYLIAQRKNLRVFIEYPEYIPGLTLGGEDFQIMLERAVITSPLFFEEKLKNLAVLNLGKASLIPIKENIETLMSLAKVAGLNVAEYGLGDTFSSPLLFIHDNNFIISTTKLSSFITSRYKPYKEWHIIWDQILSWLTDTRFILPEVNLDPAPTYNEDEILPSSNMLNAIERGTDWFLRSKFLINPKNYPKVMRLEKDGINPVGGPIPDEWESGKGNFGILEGQVSNINYDGTQDVRYMIRNDVQGEVAYALASSGQLLNNSTYKKISKNLLNFLFFTSNARKGLRNRKDSPVYGLLGWADTHPYIFYSDDHARALLGAIGASAILDNTSWETKIVETILANFRLSSKEGFIGTHLFEKDVLTNGWKYYHHRSYINPHPHFESWIWACYLWLYDKTRYKPLLDRAEEGIKLTMEAYPKGWKWTNGIQQEKARMILPLAWLIKVDDSPEHRKWLDFMVNEVLKFQQDNGAIQEEVKEDNLGIAGLVRSNEDYGKYEASLIAHNGDPIADMLYTNNFAFFALNEAAKATGNDKYKFAVKKLADFLTRIQIKSELHPEIDGAWFRGFDYEIWDYWGSNADVEWGVWCTLTGWIQSWIISTLNLVNANQSFWDTTKHLNMEKAFNESLWMLNEGISQGNRN